MSSPRIQHVVALLTLPYNLLVFLPSSEDMFYLLSDLWPNADTTTVLYICLFSLSSSSLDLMQHAGISVNAILRHFEGMVDGKSLVG
jgi:hypothetical protein